MVHWYKTIELIECLTHVVKVKNTLLDNSFTGGSLRPPSISVINNQIIRLFHINNEVNII